MQYEKGRSYSNFIHQFNHFTIVRRQSFLLLKTPAKPDFKLKPSKPIFNVRFYCNDGRFYYMHFKTPGSFTVNENCQGFT